MGEFFDQLILVEKLFEYDTQHRVGRNGENHARDACHAACHEEDNKDFQGVGMDAVTVYQGLEECIVNQTGDEHRCRHADQERQGLGVEIHVEVEDNAHRQAKEDANERTNIRNDIEHARHKGNNHGIVDVQADDGKPQRIQCHHAQNFQEKPDEVAHQQFLDGIEGIARLLLIARGNDCQDHARKEVAVLEEKESDKSYRKEGYKSVGQSAKHGTEPSAQAGNIQPIGQFIRKVNVHVLRFLHQTVVFQETPGVFDGTLQLGDDFRDADILQ